MRCGIPVRAAANAQQSGAATMLQRYRDGLRQNVLSTNAVIADESRRLGRKTYNMRDLGVEINTQFQVFDSNALMAVFGQRLTSNVEATVELKQEMQQYCSKTWTDVDKQKAATIV